MSFLTGFGPFEGVDENPSQILAEALREDDCIMKARISHVSMSGVDQVLEDMSLCDEPENDSFWIHLGVDSKSTCMRLELYGYNECTFRISDQDGNKPNKQKINSNMALQHSICSRLDLSKLKSSMETVGAVCYSRDPGRYICNYIYYSSLSVHRYVVFIHVPLFSVISLEQQQAMLRNMFQALPYARIDCNRVPDILSDMNHNSLNGAMSVSALRRAWVACSESSDYKVIQEYAGEHEGNSDDLLETAEQIISLVKKPGAIKLALLIPRENKIESMVVNGCHSAMMACRNSRNFDQWVEQGESILCFLIDSEELLDTAISLAQLLRVNCIRHGSGVVAMGPDVANIIDEIMSSSKLKEF